MAERRGATGTRWERGARLIGAALLTAATPGLAGCLGTGGNPLANLDEPPPNIAKPSDLDDDALGRIARTAEESGALIDAASVYRRLAERQPSSPGPRVELGRHLLKRGDPAGAEAAFREALVLAPNDDGAQLGLGQALVAQGRSEDALAAYQAVRARKPGDLSAVNGAGVALDSLRRHDEAQALYREGLAQAPNDLNLRSNLGLSLAYSGRLDEALTVLRALAADPNAEPRHKATLDRVQAMRGRRGAPTV